MVETIAQASTAAPFINPFDPSMRQKAMQIQQRMMLAQQLMDDGKEPQGTEMAGNLAVPQSPFSAAGHAISKALGGYEQRKTMGDMADMQTQGYQAMLAAATGQPASMAPDSGNGGAAGAAPTPTGGAGPGPGGLDRATAMRLLMLDPTGKALADAVASNAKATDMMKNDNWMGVAPSQEKGMKGGEFAKNVGVSGGMPSFDGNGQPTITPIPGAASTQAGFTGAQEAAKAPYGTPITVPGADGQTRLMRPDQVQAAAGPMPGVNTSAQSGAQNPEEPPPPPGQSVTMPPPIPTTANADGSPTAPPPGPVDASPLPPVGQALPPDDSVSRTPGLSDATAPGPAASAALTGQPAPPVSGGVPGLPVQNAAEAKGHETDMVNSENYKNDLIGRVAENEKAMRIINTQEALLDKFKSGAWTTDRANVANMAASLGAGPDVVQKIAGGDPSAVQAFEGLASQHALLQLKSLADGNRINKTEFSAFKDDLANPDKMDGGIRAINQMQRSTYTADVSELGALTNWEKAGKPLNQFRQNYAQQVAQQLTGPQGASSNGPTIGTVDSGYRFKGGDPSDQKNWEKI